jgi:mono/diheme cytochrome c family protein
MYTGVKKSFGEKNLAKMKTRAERTYIKTPDIDKDNLDIGKLAFDGQKIYENYCRACHQRNGKGDEVRFPPLLNSEWVTGDKKKLAGVILHGLNGPVKVAGKDYNNVMPAFDFLTDQQIADLLSYVRQKFGNNADSVKADLVKDVRSKK